MRLTCDQADINTKEATKNSVTGDYNPISLTSTINTEALNSVVVQTWLDEPGERVSALA